MSDATPKMRGKRFDLTWLLEDRVHLTGLDCLAIRSLRQLQATFSYPWYRGPRIQFWQTGNTNPAKVNCVNCWQESDLVKSAAAKVRSRA